MGRQLFDQGIMDLAFDINPFRAVADLPGVNDARVVDGLGRQIEIGILQNNRRGLAPQFQIDPCQVLARHLHDMRSGRHAVGKSNQIHLWMRDQRLTRYSSASTDKIENPFWQIGFCQQLGKEIGYER